MSAPVLPKRHEEYEELAVAWAIDALEPADQVIFEDHWPGCARCEQIVLTTLRVAVELAYAVPDVVPPRRLRDQVMAAATPRVPVPAASPENTPDAATGAGSTRPDADTGARPARPDADTGPRPARPDVDTGPRPPRPDDDTGTGPARPATGTSGEAARPDITTGGGLARPDITSGGGPAWPDPDASAGTGIGIGQPGDVVGAGAGRAEPATGAGPWTAGAGGRRRVPARSGAHRRGSIAGARDERVRPGGGRRRRLVSVLAAVALVGVSAVTTWEVTRPEPVASPVAAAERTAALSAPDGNRTLATVVVRGDDVHVVADGLTRSADGREYKVWGVPSGGSGTPQVVGSFRVTADGLHSYAVTTTRSLDDYPVLAVSDEAAGSTPAAPSSVLARGALDH